MTVALDDAEEVRARPRPRLATGSRGPLRGARARGGAGGGSRRSPPALRAAFAFPRDGVARAGRVGRALALACSGRRRPRPRGDRRRSAIGLAAGRVAGVETSARAPRRPEAVVLAGRERPGPSRRRPAPPARRLLPDVAAAGRRVRPGPAVRASSPRAGSASSRGATGRSSQSGRPGPDDTAPAARAPGRVAALLAEVQRLVPASSGWGLVEAGRGTRGLGA